MELYENYLKMFNLFNPKFIQAYMVVVVDKTMVFKGIFNVDFEGYFKGFFMRVSKGDFK